ncbi:hypothetical protein J4H92_08535 [Leucobacter weissii]|uniref:Uncharacterized protein n=1 Tax=Leucobacter weissii TaxID=1983706 RepID=A0A939SC43_9MICO|nr:hypothetical protein [Leucobacter weissii]MBO1901993.1 hypothetical protein [Leucobacter weissii]
MAAQTLRGAPRLREARGSGRLPKYPARRWARWALRLGFALPFLALALLLDANDDGYFSGETANAELLAEVRGVGAGEVGIDVLGALYPPISSLIALLVPGGALGLGIVGSLVAGFFCQRVFEWFTRRRVPRLDGSILLLLIAGTPLTAFLVTTNLEMTLGAVLFGLGMIDLIRFIVYANTQAGFRVGLYFATAALSAPAFIFSILLAGCVAPLLYHSRLGSRIANALVLVFPTVAAFGSASLLGLVFRSDPLLPLRNTGFDPADDRLQATLDVLGSSWGWLHFVPTVLSMLLALAAQRPLIALAPPLITASFLLMSATGVSPVGSSGTSFLILATVVAAICAQRLRDWHRVAALTLVVLQALVGWALSFLLYPSVGQWWRALTGGALG